MVPDPLNHRTPIAHRGKPPRNPLKNRDYQQYPLTNRDYPPNKDYFSSACSCSFFDPVKGSAVTCSFFDPVKGSVVTCSVFFDPVKGSACNCSFLDPVKGSEEFGF